MKFSANGQALDALAVDSSVVTDWIDVGKYRGLSVNLAWTGAGVGEFTLEGANGKSDALATTLTGTTVQTSDGSPALVELADVYCQFVRLRYTRTSGTIALTANVHAK